MVGVITCIAMAAFPTQHSSTARGCRAPGITPQWLERVLQHGYILPIQRSDAAVNRRLLRCGTVSHLSVLRVEGYMKNLIFGLMCLLLLTSAVIAQDAPGLGPVQTVTAPPAVTIVTAPAIGPTLYPQVDTGFPATVPAPLLVMPTTTAGAPALMPATVVPPVPTQWDLYMALITRLFALQKDVTRVTADLHVYEYLLDNTADPTKRADLQVVVWTLQTQQAILQIEVQMVSQQMAELDI